MKWIFLIYGKMFGFPWTQILTEDFCQKCINQDWDRLEIRSGLKEGYGVFAKRVFSKGEYLCNYGGLMVSKVYAKQNLLPYDEKCNYLVELQEETCHELDTFYINYNSSKQKTCGQLINHPSQHPNATMWTYTVSINVLDLMFSANRTINPGEQITWNYGKEYSGVNLCVESCQKCKQGKD